MKTITLLKARLKGNLFSTSYLKDLYRRDRLWVLPAAGLGIAAGAGFFIVMLYQNYKALFTMGAQGGVPETVILMSGIMSGLMIFFVGTPLCLSNIFYSKDNILTSSLPVTPAEIIGSRMISVYLFTLPIHLAVVIPAIAVYLPSESSLPAVISTVVFCLTGTLVPLLAAFGASAAIAGLGNLSGHKTAIELAGMSAAVLLLGAVQLTAARSMMSSGGLSAVAETLMKYAAMLGRIFFASKWTAAGFTAGGTVGLLLSAAFRAAAAITVSRLLAVSGFKIPAQTSGASAKAVRRKRSSGQVEASAAVVFRQSSVTAALIKREWSVVKSNSAFIFEIAGEVLILPILLTVFYFSMPGDIKDFIFEAAGNSEVIPLIVMAMMIIMNSINSISSTSLSREGTSFAVSKAIPVKGSTQVKAKMYFHLILLTASWFLNLVILVIMLKIPPVHLVYLIPAGPAVVLLGFCASIHIDLMRPVLKWSHPQQAMKQNMNVLIGMGFGLLIWAGLVIPGAGLYLAGLRPVLCGISVPLIAGALDVILIPRILKYSESRYIEITV